jgi:two-component system, OmpR family, response regulator
MQEAKIPSIPRPGVLCVDDDEDSRVMLTTLLGIALIEAKAVGTAAQALSSIRSEHFDLYLLDSRLSDADGFELCRQIRVYDPQTPILFFSGEGFDADKKKGIEAGANDYVIKPDLEALLGSIKQFVSQAEGAAAKTLPSRPNINSFSPFTFDPAAA